MFERFTDRARRVVVLAQEEARRLGHNYIGTEHVLLGLLGEGEGVAARALKRFDVTLEGTRDEVRAIVGSGTGMVKGHIPFTPRAKKVLEMALREALELNHNYIGTEHILLGVIREGEGVGASILKEHSADLLPVRAAVLDLLQSAGASLGGRRLRRRIRAMTGRGEAPEPPDMPADQPTTPAADASLNEAARLASGHAVGSHHLMLAALHDPDSAAARALNALGVDLDRAREALRDADVTGTSDELPEEAGRRQMLIRVADDRLTIEATDPMIIDLGRAAVEAAGDQADPPGTIRGDQPASESLSDLWVALRDSLDDIRSRLRPPKPLDVKQSGQAEDVKPPEPGTEVA
jgi:ATP-dependent Clp protease ATP-binding subunit ClpA